MGTWGFFDSDVLWDSLSDPGGLSHIAGFDLALIGCSNEDWKDGDLPVMSKEEAKAHLDNGHFDDVFDILKSKRDYWHLCVFLVISMTLGVTISKKQLGYIKRIYKKIEPGVMFDHHKQIELAFKEYKSGEPYRVRDFDDDGQPMPEYFARKRTALASPEQNQKNEDEKTEVKGKRKLSSEGSEDLEEPAAKHAKA